MAPTYEFHCKACDLIQEENFSLKNRPEKITCAKCGGEALYKMSTSRFVVNGANAANRYSGDSNYRWLGGGDEE